MRNEMLTETEMKTLVYMMCEDAPMMEAGIVCDADVALLVRILGE